VQKHNRPRWGDTVKAEFGGFECAALAHSATGRQPVPFEPPNFGGKGLAARIKRPKLRATDRREIGRPSAVLVGLDVRPATDLGPAQCRQINLLAVDATD